MSPAEAVRTAESVPAGVPDDANDLRGFHFKRLLHKPLTWILVGIFVILAGVLCAALIGPAIGGAAALGAFLIGVLVVFAIADRKAADDFFEVYAQQRGLTLVHGRGRLPQATPLLRKGDDRYTERSLIGPIADGCDGTLALYTYEEESTDSKGNRQTSYYHYTVGFVDVPDSASLIPELYCQRKFGIRALEKFEDVFRGSKERVKLESEELDEKYEIFSGKEQDPNRLRQLLSPTFIVWLNEAAPDKFAFELVGGSLCCYVSGHKETAADLDTIASATGAVAKRLREEANE